MKNNKIMLPILITILIGCLVFYIGLNLKSFTNPKDVYMVYLSGKKVGMIEDKQVLLDKINNEQESLKEKYGVDNVYPPEGLKIVSYTSYHDNYLSTDEIYNKISNFAIKGYVVTITKKEEDLQSGEEPTRKIYVLDKDLLTKALDKMVSIFVPEDKYSQYLNNTQVAIDDTGEYIQNVYINEKVTIKEGLLNTSEDILKTYEEINQYLLYGTLTPQKKYTVKTGDTIDSIAYANGLSTAEFLISNPELKDETVLLSGNGDQTVNVSEINPLVNVVYESDLVEDQVDSYNTVIRYDPEMSVGSSYIKQQGANGVIKVKFKMQYLNGEIYQVIKVSSTELTPAVDKIVVRGGNRNSGSGVGDSTIWYWPTIKPYKITSNYGYRTLLGSDYTKFHEALDISGTGYGSPIYAANDGIVIYAQTSGDGARTIKIDHQNNYRTYYVHLKDIYVKVGQVVKSGDKIGTMGNTGNVVPRPTTKNPTAGTHLHFGVYYSSDGGQTYKSMNPLRLTFQ